MLLFVHWLYAQGETVPQGSVGAAHEPVPHRNLVVSFRVVAATGAVAFVIIVVGGN